MRYFTTTEQSVSYRDRYSLPEKVFWADTDASYRVQMRQDRCRPATKSIQDIMQVYRIIGRLDLFEPPKMPLAIMCHSARAKSTGIAYPHMSQEVVSLSLLLLLP